MPNVFTRLKNRIISLADRPFYPGIVALVAASDYFIPGSGPASIIAGEELASDDSTDETTTEAADASSPAPNGAVVFTAREEGLWVKFYDAEGERLMEKELARGESYTVPADANGPQVWTGQPESLAISVGGTEIGTLSNQPEIVRDIPANAEALLERMKVLEAQAEAERAAEDENAEQVAEQGDNPANSVG